MKELKTVDWIYIIWKIPFGEDSIQNYLVFQSLRRYFKMIPGLGKGSYIYYWKSKGLCDKIINFIKMPNYSITPILSCYGTHTRVEFNGSCLKPDYF